LSQLPEVVVPQNWDPLREVNVPSGDEGYHLCISSELSTDPETGARSLVIKVRRHDAPVGDGSYGRIMAVEGWMALVG
jgi:hypothetical protein